MTARGLIVLLSLGLVSACSSSDGSTAMASDAGIGITQDAGGGANTGIDAQDDGSTTGIGVMDPVDSSPPPDITLSPCEQRCQPFLDCGEAVHSACESTCDDAEVATCEDECVAVSPNCDRATACFNLQEEANPVPWNDGPYGTGYRQTANDFTLPTLRGDWNFATHWNGADNYIFASTQTGFQPGVELYASLPYPLFDESPMNVHYFFMSYHNAEGVDDSIENVTALKTSIDDRLNTLGEIRGKPLECHWRRRVHYVTQSPWAMQNWLGQMLQNRPSLAFGIDRYQQLRPVGLLSLVQSTNQLRHLQYPAAYYNFERKRDLSAWTGDVTQVTVYGGEAMKNQTLYVDMPSAEEMATFDTLEIDLRQYCDAHDDQNCFEWDYKAWLEVREQPAVAENPNAETACQPKVNGVEGQAEVLGTCEDMSECTTDTDCGDTGMCTGYQAPVEAIEAVEADTLSCQCLQPGIEGNLRDSQQVCNGEGTGYGDCQCNEAWEIARWITTYNREGRWIMDASAFLPLLDAGGTTRFRYVGAYPYNTTMHFNFSNRGKADRAATVTKLFNGGGFGPNYSLDKEAITLPIAGSTIRSEVLAFITGHGFGGIPHNCAEFCNHTHHFTVNDTEFVKSHQYINDYYGCAKQVGLGTVPNQFGTWTIGRGGWCPGMDVKPFVADVSDVTTPMTTLGYRGYLNGVPYQEGQANYGGSIWMNSYFITYE